MDGEKNTVVQGRYRLVRCVGEGSQGRVFLAEDLGRGGEHVAVKLVEAMVGGQRDTSADGILRWFRHPNWAPILDGGRWGDDGWFQVSRFIRGSNLEALEGPQPESWIWKFIECGARVLGALHRHNIIHYDITPGNWMVEERSGEPSFVLTDGGLAHEGPVQGLGRGTPRFMAPEVTKDVAHDHRADLYSLGLVAYRLATGRDPFEGRAGEVLGQRRRIPAPRARVHRPDLDPGLDSVIGALLERQPQDRPDSGASLLELIATTRDTTIPPYTEEEAAAAAGGGRLVGRRKEMQRFQDICASLTPRLASKQAPFIAREVPRLPDSVLLLSGKSGTGATRLAREMQRAARDASLPTVVVGSQICEQGAGAVARELERGLLATQGQSRPQRRRRGPERPGNETDRGIESLISVVKDLDRATPAIIFVENFHAFSEDSKRAIQVLSRFLLSQHESARGPNTLSTALVVDLGPTSADDLILADSDEPQRPIVDLGGVSPEAVKRICQGRVPGLQLETSALSALVSSTEGRPGRVVAFLGEALLREDLAMAGEEWSWDTSKLNSYRIEESLEPSQRLSLSRCSNEELSALRGACLARRELPLVALQTLAPNGVSHRVLALLRRQGTGVVPASEALRRTVVCQTSKEERRAIASRLLSRDGIGVRARSHLMLAMDDFEGVLEALARDPSSATRERQLVLEALQRTPEIDVNVLERIASSLGEDRTSLETALLLRAKATSGLGSETTLKIATVLRQHGHTQAALSFCEGQASTAVPRRYELAIACARLALATQDLGKARRWLGRARSNKPSSRSHRELALAALATASYAFFSGSAAVARRLFGAAAKHARISRQIELLADGLNGLGVAEQVLGNSPEAGRHLARAARLYSALGDVHGALRAQFNQAKTAHHFGDLAIAAATYQSVATLAARHRRNEALSRTLRALAHLYDQRLNSKLALRTLRRALREAIHNQSEPRLANAAWDIAPLAAAVGDQDLCRQALLMSANHVRRMPSAFSRAQHHLSKGLALLHTGDHSVAAMACTRAMRHGHALPNESRARLWLLAHCTAHRALAEVPPPARPARSSPERNAYRLCIWAARIGGAKRGKVSLPAPSSLTPTRGRRTGVEGWIRRVYAELILAGTRLGSLARSSTLLKAMERSAQHSGEKYLHARLVAAMCTHTSGGYQTIAQMFSRCVAALPNSDSSKGTGIVVPREHRDAANHVAHRLGLPPNMEPTTLSGLHAIAHQSLLQAGGVVAADDRVSTALRSVLEATAMLNTGGDVEALLDAITNQAIEITGAERACVVRIAASGTHQVTTALSASVDAAEAARPVSQTVIARTMETRRPLLLHDVFDDEELMQRPSITSLSLRSIICVPIRRGERFFGVIYADDASAAAAFDQIDLEILSLYADQVAGMLEAHRLLEDLQESMRELKTTQERLVKGERLRVIGEISSGVAHEFNNLLTGILARVQLAKLSPLPTTLANDLNLIEKAALDAAAIVRRLQGFSRSERQQGFVSVDFTEICSDAIEFLKPLWAGRGPTADSRTVRFVTDGEALVSGSPVELRELVTNLLKNSLDATTQGGLVELHLSKMSGAARLVVRDNGSGIPAHIKARVFDPFFTTKGERGTGLGLALCQQIVERHGGSLGIESEEGRGTEIVVELPMIDARGGDTATGAHALTILVLDDDSDVRLPLCDYLRRAGHLALPASSAEHALKVVGQQRVDVALVDIHLPGMSGLGFCSEFKKSFPNTPVVLMSGRAEEMDPAKVKGAGAQNLLAKPFAMQSVQRLIEDVAGD